jgi:predicted nucleotidyltransferase component of viral defense system
MIPEIFIRDWELQAPWSTLGMIEQDLMLSRILVELYQNQKIKDSLIFRGGTALNKLYIKPPARYSEDLDFVQLYSEPIGPIIAAIRNILDRWLGTPKGKLTERSAKLIYRYVSHDNNPAKIKIEINTTEHFQVKNLKQITYSLDSEWYSGSSEIVTYELEELMATKLKALYQRRKGRDLFDLWYVFKNHDIDISDVLRIFHEYCKRDEQIITKALFEKNLSQKFLNRDFKTDMQALLAQGIDYHFENAFGFVSDYIINRIPGKAWKGEQVVTS